MKMLSLAVIAPLCSAPDVLRRLGLGSISDDAGGIAETLSGYVYILAPVLILGTIILIGWGIFAAAASDEITGAAKAEYKGEIIVALRRDIAGLSVAEVARLLKLREGQAEFLLKSLQEESLLYKSDRNGTPVYRLRGIGP